MSHRRLSQLCFPMTQENSVGALLFEDAFCFSHPSAGDPANTLFLGLCWENKGKLLRASAACKTPSWLGTIPRVWLFGCMDVCFLEGTCCFGYKGKPNGKTPFAGVPQRSPMWVGLGFRRLLLKGCRHPKDKVLAEPAGMPQLPFSGRSFVWIPRVSTGGTEPRW